MTLHRIIDQHIHTYIHQYCESLGGLCDSLHMALSDPGSKCSSNADCTEDGKHKTPKLPCCDSYAAKVQLSCDKIPSDFMVATIASAKASGSCADTNCYPWKVMARGSASSMQVSTWLLAVVVGLNTLFTIRK